MTPEGNVLLLVAVTTVLALATLTAVGERRRGAPLTVVVVAGLFFPLAWIVWYTHDELHESAS